MSIRDPRNDTIQQDCCNGHHCYHSYPGSYGGSRGDTRDDVRCCKCGQSQPCWEDRDDNWRQSSR